MVDVVFGIIGGFGIYDLLGFEDFEWIIVDSFWGMLLDYVCIGQIDGLKIVFLLCYGCGYVYFLIIINYCVNIDVMKCCGVIDLLFVLVCGLLKEEYELGMFVLVDQFIDWIIVWEKSFFGIGCVVYVFMVILVSLKFVDVVVVVVEVEDLKYYKGGMYFVMEGF